jgi:hypothetical protein
MMRDDEIESVLNYLARQGAAHSNVAFDSLEQQVRKTLKVVADCNRQTTRLIKEMKRRGRLIDIRLALLRWRLESAND